MSQNPAIKQFQLAGTIYDLQVDSVNNCNPTATDTSKFDWVGTQAEYVAQDVATEHPDWLCYITDDISDEDGRIDLSNYVKKAGDEEIGGTKTFTSSTIYLKSETPYNQTPATTQHTKLYITDGTTVFGAVESAQRPDGANGMQINAKGQNGNWSDSPIGVAVDSSGNTFTYAPTPSSVSNNNTIATTAYITTVLSTLYPVGSLYLGTQTTCPLITLIPGSTWTLVSSGKALWTGNGTNANTIIDAGLPNITGDLVFESLGDKATGIGGTGAFTLNITTQGNDSWGHDGTYGRKHSVNFNASRSSGIYGNSTTVQPPAYVTNVWRRTA